MRLLSIVWYKVLPPHYGGQKGIALFNKYLGAKTTLTCLCSRNNEPDGILSYNLIPELPVSKDQFLNPFWWYRIVRAAKRTKSTHIILEHPYYGFAGWLTKKMTGCKIIVHEHNIEYLRFRKSGKKWWKSLKQLESFTLKHADLILFKTRQDQEQAIADFSLLPEQTFVLPYCIEKPLLNTSNEQARSAIYKQYRLSPDTKLFLFAGTLDYEPNAQAVELIVNQIIPRLQALKKIDFTIIVCGRNKLQAFQYLKDLVAPNFIYAGEVDNIASYFQACDAFIDPVVQLNGVQTKILEALSYHCNVVSFNSGLEGVTIYEHKVFPAVSFDWDEFCTKMIEAVSVKTDTPDSFYERHSWERAIESLLPKLAACQDQIL